MRKILLADGSGLFLQELTQLLQPHCHVLSCRDGNQALQLLRREACDIIVLDLMLPGLDGLSLLEKASAESCMPPSLVLTPLISGYVLSVAERLQVRYLLRTPCDVEAVAARVMDLLQMLPEPAPAPDPRGFVCSLLCSLGLSPKHDGYHYLAECILRFAREPDLAFTKVLYPEVGRLFHRSGSQVERSIRNALDCAWKRQKDAPWSQYFPPGARRPVSAAVITRLAEDVRKLQE